MTQKRLFPELPEQEPAASAPPDPPTCPSQARLYKPVRNQVEIVMRDFDSVLPADHLARAIWGIVEPLDLSAF